MTSVQTQTETSDKPQIEKKPITYYFLPPPMIQPYYEYQDINQDQQLRIDVVNYFYNKLLKWISSSSMYKKYRSHEDYIYNNKTKIKYKLYKLLRFFVKKADINWYELRTNHFIIKEFIKNKFELLL